jgi:hypothetical protein
MSESVNRDGFPKTGNFLSFLKMFTALDPSRRKNVFISPTETPGSFNYCVFPSIVSLPPECQRLLKTAEEVAEIMGEANVSQLPSQRRGA